MQGRGKISHHTVQRLHVIMHGTPMSSTMLGPSGIHLLQARPDAAWSAGSTQLLVLTLRVL
jgi:hypothetical protein